MVRVYRVVWFLFTKGVVRSLVRWCWVSCCQRPLSYLQNTSQAEEFRMFSTLHRPHTVNTLGNTSQSTVNVGVFFFSSTIDCTYMFIHNLLHMFILFWAKRVNLEGKIDLFITFMVINFLVRMLQYICRNFNIVIFRTDHNNPSCPDHSS